MNAPRPISHATSLSLELDGVQLTPLEALALLVCRDFDRSATEPRPDWLREGWRRYCASNLTFTEWRRKAWAGLKALQYHRNALVKLVRLGLVQRHCQGCSERGAALAEKLRPLFVAPMPGWQFREFTQSTYARVSRRSAV
jgi:hypothetical protein